MMSTLKGNCMVERLEAHAGEPTQRIELILLVGRAVVWRVVDAGVD